MKIESEVIGANTLGSDFAGQVAIVTGGGSGIGRAVAAALASMGAQVAVLDIALAQSQETVRQLPGTGHLAVDCDVSSPPSVSAAFEQVTAGFGQIDVLVNNAGINPPVASSIEADSAFYDLVMEVNVRGVFFCAQAAMRAMIPRRSGAIVNLASVSGMIGWGGSAVYSASKGAVIALTKAHAIELAPHGIRVNAVAPGSVRTPMVENNLRLLQDPVDAWRRAADLHPLGRVGEASEIAEAICFLASPRSSFVTGSILTIDGGLTSR